MTRDEATEAIRRNLTGSGDYADRWTKLFCELGMLKLEEPKSAEEKATLKAVVALNHEGWSLNVLNVFDRAGLKIVEK